MPLNVDFLFFLTAATILLGLIGELISKRYPVPIPLFLLLLGYVLGVATLPKFFDAIFQSSGKPLLPLSVGPFLTVAPLFATFALMMILFYGGMDLKISRLTREIPRILLEVNIYVLSGIFAIAFLTSLLLHWDIWSSLLMGSIVGGETTAAVVVPLTKLVKMKDSTKTFLVLESTINSIYSVVFFLAFLRVIQGEALGITSMLGGIGIAVLAGILAGLGFGLLWRFLAPRLVNFDFKYVLLLVFLLFAYLASDFFDGGGLVSSLVFGFVAFREIVPKTVVSNGTKTKEGMLSRFFNRNSEPVHGGTFYLSSIQHEITLVLETFFFVIMGLLLTEIPSGIVLSTLLYGGIFTLVMFVIRFVSSSVSTFRSPMAEDRNLILFTMAQGLTPAVLAVSTLTYGLANAQIYLGITLAVILYTNIITVGTPIVARVSTKRAV